MASRCVVFGTCVVVVVGDDGGESCCRDVVTNGGDDLVLQVAVVDGGGDSCGSGLGVFDGCGGRKQGTLIMNVVFVDRKIKVI